MIETELRQKMIKEAKKQGVWARSINDRFNSAYPDMRLKSPLYPHIDVELKMCGAAAGTLSNPNKAIRTGIEPLQFIEIRDMNAIGIPAVGLIYIDNLDAFTFCNAKEFVPYASLEAHWIEGNRGRPNFDLLIKRAFQYLKHEGHDFNA